MYSLVPESMISLYITKHSTLILFEKEVNHTITNLAHLDRRYTVTVEYIKDPLRIHAPLGVPMQGRRGAKGL